MTYISELIILVIEDYFFFDDQLSSCLLISCEFSLVNFVLRCSIFVLFNLVVHKMDER